MNREDDRIVVRLVEPASPEQREKNILAIIGLTLKELQGTDYKVRSRGVTTVATILGHRMGDAREQAWGLVVECTKCGCIGKAQRTGDSIEGRATSTICPAGRKSVP